MQQRVVTGQVVISWVTEPISVLTASISVPEL